MNIRNAGERDIPALARIWHEGWQYGHADILPAELARYRTLESFADRLREALGNTRIAESDGTPLGFHILQEDELYQLYVDANARGTGVAVALIDDAERRLRERGVATAWLACAIGNSRAERFYDKRGWRRTGKVTYPATIPGGTFSLDVWRYEKSLVNLA